MYSTSIVLIFPGTPDVYLTIHMKTSLVTYDNIQCEALMKVDQPMLMVPSLQGMAILDAV